jgi:hypothetical protein
MDEVVKVESVLRSAGVGFRGAPWRIAAAGVEHGGEAADIGAERSTWLISKIDVPDARCEQRAVLYLAQAVSQR